MSQHTRKVPQVVKLGQGLTKYAVAVLYEVRASSDNEAIEIAEMNATLLDKELDNRPKVQSIHRLGDGFDVVCVLGKDEYLTTVPELPFKIA